MTKVAQLNLVLVATDPNIITQTRTTLSSRQGWEVSSLSTVAAAKQTTPAPDILLLHESIADSTLVDAVRKLAVELPDTAILPLVQMSDMATVRDAVLAGARGFVSLPLKKDELITTIEQLAEARTQPVRRSSSTSAQSDWKASDGPVQIIAVVGPRGGVGRTMIAVNLAILLQKTSGGQVALVDAQSTLGDTGLMLNLQPTYTIMDLLPRLDDLDDELLTGVMSHHTSGLRVLHSAPALMHMGRVDAEHMEVLLSRLTRIYQYVVIDTGSLSDATLPVILEQADRVVLVMTPDMAAVRRSVLFLEAAQGAGYPVNRILSLLNRGDMKGGLELSAIEQHMGMDMKIMVPDDPALVTYSNNRGVPLVTSHPKSAVAKSLEKLAREVAGVSVAGGHNPLKALTSRIGGLFSKN